MARNRNEIEKTANSTVYRKLLRFEFRCSFCPPNRYENANHQAKHGKTKPRYKDKPRGPKK